jgi:hypothetical protein
MVLDEIERARRTGRRDYDRSMGRRQHLGAQRRAHKTTEHGKEINKHTRKRKKRKKKSRVAFDRPQSEWMTTTTPSCYVREKGKLNEKSNDGVLSMMRLSRFPQF